MTYNFGVTPAGEQQGLTAVNVNFTVNRGQNVNDNIVFKIYDGLGGTGNVVSTTTALASTWVSGGGFVSQNVPLSSNLSLVSGYYSIQITTTATKSNDFQWKTGPLVLNDSTTGAPLSGLYFVEDSNTTGTAGTTLSAATTVLAQAVLSTKTVNFGNFRVGSTGASLSQAVSLQNDNLATSNNMSQALTGSLTTFTAGATLTGLPSGAAALAQSVSTSVTAGLSVATGTGGSVSGSLDVGFTSVQGASAATGTTVLPSQTINLSGTAYREAVASYSTTSPDLGKYHTGSTNVSGSFTLTNNVTADAYSEGLAASESSTTGGASVTSALPTDGSPLAAGSNTTVNVQLASVSAVGANTGTVTLALDSSGTGTSGLAAASLGTQVLNVSAQGYSGQSVWQTNSSGTWGSFSDWDTPGGTPGVDGSLSVNDTATFGSAASSATTVSLDGKSPTLATLTFSNSAASYTIRPGTGGSMTVGTSAATGAINVTAGSHSIAAGLALGRNTSVDTSTGTVLTLSGAVSGANALSKTGAGTLEITGTGTLSGATTVSDGTLRVNGSIASSDVTVQSGATIAGSGTVGSVTIASGGTLSPGNSPGNLTVNGNEVWSGGGNYNWQIYDVDGTAGTDWDLTTITGNLDLSGLTGANPYNINLWSLSQINADVSGNALNFDNTQLYSWTIASAGSISGFDASTFAINTSSTNGTSGFSNNLGGGSFSVEQSGSNLNLVFTPTPVPEPATLVLLAAAAALGGARRARRWWVATAA